MSGAVTEKVAALAGAGLGEGVGEVAWSGIEAGTRAEAINISGLNALPWQYRGKPCHVCQLAKCCYLENLY